MGDFLDSFRQLVDDNQDIVVPVARASLGPVSAIAQGVAQAGELAQDRAFMRDLDRTLGFAGSGLVIDAYARAGLEPPQEAVQEARAFLAPDVSDRPVDVLRNMAEQQGEGVFRFVGDQLARQQAQDAIAALEQQRALFMRMKNEAVRKAGAGAAAGFNAAIARIDNELARLRKGLQNIDILFERKAKNLNTIYDTAAENLIDITKGNVEEIERLAAESQAAIAAQFTDAQRRVSDFAKSIGVDDVESIRLSEEVGRIEEAILQSDEIDGDSKANLLRQAENVAVTAARAAKSNSLLELKRKEILLESQLKEQINNLVEQRKVMVAQRRSAVSAARRAAAAMYPDNLPTTPEAFASFAVDQYMNQELADLPVAIQRQVAQMTAAFIQQGVPPYKLLQMLSKPPEGMLQDLQKFGYDPETANAIVTTLQSMPREAAVVVRRVMPLGVDLYSNSVEQGNALLRTNPINTPPDSVERMMALQGYAQGLGMSPEEARTVASNDVLLSADSATLTELLR